MKITYRKVREFISPRNKRELHAAHCEIERMLSEARHLVDVSPLLSRMLLDQAEDLQEALDRASTLRISPEETEVDFAEISRTYERERKALGL